MKPVAVICAAVVVAVAHCARSPRNAYEAVIEVAEEEREASHAKEQAAKWRLDKVLTGEKVGSLITASSQFVKPFEPSKSVKDAKMPAAWTQQWSEMSSLVTDMQDDAKKGKMDPSVEAAMAPGKDQAPKKENTGMEYKVFEAETVLGESEQMRHKGDIKQTLPPVAAGQSWSAIKAAEDASAKTILAPGARVQNWENAMSKDLKDAADSVKNEHAQHQAKIVVEAASKASEVIAKGEQAVKKGPALLENAPKKTLGAIHKDAHIDKDRKSVHVNQGGNKVWPNVMPSMQVNVDEKSPKPVPFKKVPFKKVAPATVTSPRAPAKAGTAANKALQEAAVRDLEAFHSDPMYQHLLGPAEDPELSAQTQQDLKLLHDALGKSKQLVAEDTSMPVVAQHPAVKPAVAKPAVAMPAAKNHGVAQPPAQRVAQKPVTQKQVVPVHKPIAQKQSAQKPATATPISKPVAPRVVAKPVVTPATAAAPDHAPRAVAPQHAKPIVPGHVTQNYIPQHVAPKPVVSAHPHPQEQHQQPPTAHKQPVGPARQPAFRPPSSQKADVKKAVQHVAQPTTHGAKLWTADMDPDHHEARVAESKEDSLEARVAEQAAETRAEMEKEIASTDEEFPVPITRSFSHFSKSSRGKVGIPEGFGTKTVPMEGNRDQGQSSDTYVNHEDGKSMTKDWGTEYGQRFAEHEQAPAVAPPVKGGAAAWTASCLLVALLVIS